MLWLSKQFTQVPYHRNHGKILFKGQWCCAAGNITVSLAENNIWLPGAWLSHLHGVCLWTRMDQLMPQWSYHTWELLLADSLFVLEVLFIPSDKVCNFNECVGVKRSVGSGEQGAFQHRWWLVLSAEYNWSHSCCEAMYRSGYNGRYMLENTSRTCWESGSKMDTSVMLSSMAVIICRSNSLVICLNLVYQIYGYRLALCLCHNWGYSLVLQIRGTYVAL